MRAMAASARVSRAAAATLLLVLCASSAAAAALPPLVEPWQPLHGGTYNPGSGSAQNPDPLRDFTWDTSKLANASALQTLMVLPQSAVVVLGDNAGFAGVASLVNSSDASLQVTGSGTVRVDYGRELAAWLELTSPDLRPEVAAACVSMSVSEMQVPQFFSPARLPPKYNASNGWKTATPVAYDGGVFRLELNDDLYEGVRFGFLHVDAHCAAAGSGPHSDVAFTPFTVTSLRAVAQVKPTNWVGSFSAPASHRVLEQAWYVGGYSVKLNLLLDAFGAILDDRGDRHAFTGDAHPSQATSMAAFANYDFVNASIWSTGAVLSGYGTYPMYWVLSLVDYFDATGDSTTMCALLPRADSFMQTSLARLRAPKLTGTAGYAGWDERIYSRTLTGEYYPENRLLMKALYTRASRDSAAAALHCANRTYAQHYSMQAKSMAAELRAGGTDAVPWWQPLGIHAAAHAATAGIVNATERPLVFAHRFNDTATICSYSQFNQYYILQALHNLGYPQYALASIDLCWGGSLALGATSFWEVAGYGGAWQTALRRFGANPPLPAHSSGSDSACHPWSAGVTAWLTQFAAGLRPCEPGYGCLTVKPLLAVVNASIRAPRGEVAVAIDAERRAHTVQWPRGVIADIFLPVASELCAAAGTGSTMGDVAVGSATVVLDDGATPAREVDADVIVAPGGIVYAHLRTGVVGTGRATSLTVSRLLCNSFARGSERSVPQPSHGNVAPHYYPEPRWRVPLVAVDTTTRGSWIGRYGSQGYMLFGLNATKLPSDVTVTEAPLDSGFGSRFDHVWDANVKPTHPKYDSALQLPGSGPASAGGVAPDSHVRGIGRAETVYLDPIGIDVVASPPRSACFNLTLYYVDWDGFQSPMLGSGMNATRAQAATVFTLDPGVAVDIGYGAAVSAAPTLGLGEHHTFRVCNTSVRVRLFATVGHSAVVSALFFD